MWIRLALALTALLGTQPAAAADDRIIAGASQAIADALVPISLARGLLAACASRDPAGAAGRSTVHVAWRQANGVDGFEAAMAEVQAQSPQLAASRDRLETASAAEAAKAVEKDPDTCRQLPTVLSTPQFQIGGVTAQAERVLHSLAASRNPTPPQRNSPRSEHGPGRAIPEFARTATIEADPSFAPFDPFGYVRGRSGSTRSSAG